MLYLRHLPLISIVCADIGNKVLFDEDPGFAYLRSRDTPELGLRAQPFGVTVQKGSGLREAERFHAVLLGGHGP
jgi:hypothetical protein